MSKHWYPDIDYTKCTYCGYCVDLCEHGVYEKLKSPTPVVVFPEGCTEGCKYCGVMCPSNAIKYVAGDIEYQCDGGRFCGCCG
ncbi:MAG: 4Fe-4S binding protein [Candidatus Humimicrobiaceae bacterium]